MLALEILRDLGLDGAEINSGGSLPGGHPPIDNVRCNEDARDEYRPKRQAPTPPLPDRWGTQASDAATPTCGSTKAGVISGFLRGLSTRDVEAALEEVFEEPVASKSTVSRICEDTRERYRQWCRRRLEQHDIVYCFLDAIYLKLRPDDTPSEGVLVCWGVTWGVTLEGRKVLLGLAWGAARATRHGSRSAAT